MILGSGYGQNFYKERISRDNIFTVGIGPSFAYLDNGGGYKELDFAVKPSLSIGLIKKVSSRMEFRTSAGFQEISSGGSPTQEMIDIWRLFNSSITVKGAAYFLDFIPSFYLVPFSNHMERSKVNFYGGAGLGTMLAVSRQTKSTNPQEKPYRSSIFTGYIPVRAGLGIRMSPYSDLGAEGMMFWTFSDNLDGNAGYNKFGDHLFQVQLVFRKYFVPKGME